MRRAAGPLAGAILAGALAASVSACRPAARLEPAWEELRLAALAYAREYEAAHASYVWGAQDPLPRLAVDCSGLVVRAYGYACEDAGARLPFEDCTAAGMRDWSEELERPEPGDLLFMGEDGVVSHIALFVAEEGGDIRFIDSTYRPEEGIDGVTERSYPSGDGRFIAVGRLLVWRPLP